jgi:hypothetical protein
MNARLIQKEELPMMPLKAVDYNNSNSLSNKLIDAVHLSNSNKNKCIITLQGADGLISVNTTIWYASNEHICLKGGITIPIKCIYDIEL